jgi:hypothetical protein
MRGLLSVVAISLLGPFSLFSQTSDRWTEKRAPTFEDFRVEQTFKNPSHPIDLSSHPQGRMYRTRLREAAVRPPDFAGHYVVAEWGCGTGCAVHRLIDLKTGGIYNAPSATRGFEYRIDSALVIQDPPGGFPAYYLAPVKYWLWTGAEFELLYQEECVVVDKKQTCRAE